MYSTFPSIGKNDTASALVGWHTVSISSSVALRIYSDTRPHNWKIADLQKGLILVHDGTETVGEGTGFGFPILVYVDETYFSATSTVFLRQQKNCWVIRKEFIMDRMARNNFGSIKLENKPARSFFACLGDLYRKHPRLRFLQLKGLTGKMRVDTVFVETVPAGKVAVTYTIEKQRIMVEADFKSVRRKKLQQIFMLNEQGSTFFRKYTDSQNAELTDGKIGAWDTVDAEWACLTVPWGRFGFRLWKLKDSVLRRGREFLEGSLDWVGLDYEIDPRKTVFVYQIEMLGV